MSTNTRPILFKDEMVRAILDGRKTQTRRVIKPSQAKYPHYVYGSIRNTQNEIFGLFNYMPDGPGTERVEHSTIACPYGKPGDRLWVRETWQHINNEGQKADEFEHWQQSPSNCFYLADESSPNNKPMSGRWRPSIHMPRWASRITLEITNVRVERLQDVSEGDAKAEGAKSVDPVTGRECVLDRAMGSYRLHFQSIWQSINGPESWEANPWVWVIEFKRIPQEAGQ